MPHFCFALRALLLALAFLAWSVGAVWADDPPLVSLTLQEQFWVGGTTQTYDVPIFFTDPDTPDATYDFTATLMDGSPLPAWLTMSLSGKLTNTGAVVPPGVYRLRITATNRTLPAHHLSTLLSLVVSGHSPTCSDVTVSVLQGSTHRFTAADFGFSDSLDTPPDAFLGLHFGLASNNLFVNNNTCRPDMIFNWEPLLGYASEERALPSFASVLAMSPDGSVIAVADYDGHLQITTDDGQNWQEIDPGGKVAAVRFRGSNAKLLALTNDARRFWTDDGGATWTQKGSGYFVGSDDGQIQLQKNATRLLRSVDGGTTWQETGPSGTWNAFASSADGTHLAAALNYFDGDTIYVSTDTGVTWEATASAYLQ